MLTIDLPGDCYLAVSDPWVRKTDEVVPVLLWSPGITGSAVFLDWRPVSWPFEDRGLIEEQLLDSTKAFINHGICAGETASIKDATSASVRADSMHSVRTTIRMRSKDMWLVQLTYVPSRLVYIMHWNGPKVELKKVEQVVFDAFRVKC